jgi:hypothetical protein
VILKISDFKNVIFKNIIFKIALIEIALPPTNLVKKEMVGVNNLPIFFLCFYKFNRLTIRYY